MVVSRWPMRIGIGQILVEPLVHLRLVIVQIHLRRTADHVQIDDLLGLGRKMRARWACHSALAASFFRGGLQQLRAPSMPRAAAPMKLAPRLKNWRRVS